MSGEKMNDLQLPMTCVTRLIKESLPENVQVKNEAKAAIAKSASVFVLFLTSGENLSDVFSCNLCLIASHCIL